MSDAMTKASEIIAARRIRAQADAQLAHVKAYSSHEELYDLDAKMSAAITAVALGERDAGQAEGYIGSLQKRKAEVLSAMGLTVADFEPKYSCALCSDTGYMADGTRCSCLLELIRQESGRSLPPALAEKCSFDNFQLRYYPRTAQSGKSAYDIMSRVLDSCRDYAEHFSDTSDSLLFIGAPGLGKTHLSICIAKAALAKGCEVYYSPAQSLIDRYERLRFDRGPAEGDLDATRAASGCGLLIIDDLGAEFVTSFSQSVIYNIINERMVAGRPTIVSTNLSPEELKKTYSERIASRLLFEYKAFIFRGGDIRMAKN